MNKYLLFIILTFGIVSCNNPNQDTHENRNLTNRIAKLEKENKKLKDSLSRLEYNFLLSQIVLGISDDEILKVGKKNTIQFVFNTFNRKIPKYEVFKIVDGKEIKVASGDETRFKFDFVPKSVEDNSLNLVVKIPYKNRRIEIPAGLVLHVEQ